MRHRIWQEPGDTTIKITCYAADDEGTIAAANKSLLGEGHIHPSSEYLDTDDVASVLPTQRRFLDDCQLVGGVVLVNRDKAEARVMKDVRAVRDAALAASDVLAVRASEGSVVVKGSVSDYRQALRDYPAQVDLSKLSLDALEGFNPVLPVAP